MCLNFAISQKQDSEKFKQIFCHLIYQNFHEKISPSINEALKFCKSINNQQEIKQLDEDVDDREDEELQN